MRLSSVVALLLVLLVPVSSHACDLNPRVVGNEIRWDSPAGSVLFSVQELIDGRAPVFTQSRFNTYPLTRRASADTVARYIITAQIEKGTQAVESLDACVATLEVPMQADPAFRAMTRKAVLPIAGSTGGAFGGKFRTALELRGVGLMRGRVVFHPAGRAASDNDPSLPYSFTTAKPTLAWDDIVETLGQSGLGSIDIIPDEGTLDTLPEITARLYNDTPIGTFGTQEPAVLPYAYLDGPVLEVPIPDARFRVNIGIRTFTATTIKVVTYSAAGKLLGFRDVSFPAGWTMMTSATDLSREVLTPGASVTLLVDGSAVAFYTVTENQTNDPTVILAPAAPQSRNVALFVH